MPQDSMIQVKVVSNIRDCRGKFVAMREGTAKYARDLVREAGRAYVEEYRKGAPVGHHYKWDGTEIIPELRLRDSFYFRTYERKPNILLRLYTKKWWPFWWTRRGTKDRVEPIVPQTKPRLVFWWAKLGKTMYLSHVHHKGIRVTKDWGAEAEAKAEQRTAGLLRRAGRMIITTSNAPLVE